MQIICDSLSIFKRNRAISGVSRSGSRVFDCSQSYTRLLPNRAAHLQSRKRLQMVV
jgi:hypothetical protein